MNKGTWKEYQILFTCEGRQLLKCEDGENTEYTVVFFSPDTVEMYNTTSFIEAQAWFVAIKE